MKINISFFLLIFLFTFQISKAQQKNMYGIAHLSILPLRTEPSNQSELCTQILFGEIYKVIKISPDEQWFYIENNFDEYKGWLNKGQFKEISEKEFKEIAAKKKEYLCQQYTKTLLSIDKTKEIPIVFGAKLNKIDENTCKNNDFFYTYSFSEDNQNLSSNHIEALLEDAYIFLNAPYLWGGKTPFGVDCSGFTQQIMRANGIKIKRDAYQQAEQGEKINQLENTKTGDLAFFVRNNRVVHVGLIIEDKDLPKNKPNHKPDATIQKNERWIMHALECVRIDKLDEKGIFNLDNKQYSHFLHSLKRYIK
ncbi:MAG: hypothetical protein EAZ85_10675 [Bacteroidetes bacterium]|nr:MAG: hypothetical protein EAZ85_10675 [Bacteroidota bacterium]TAG85616.1 MAG: hypothetical protein EAZ20_14655 [Bacteroidota bacterium]